MQKSTYIRERTGEFAFISYSHADGDRIRQELDLLDKLGIRFWYDEALAPGGSWSQELAEAINDATYLFFFASALSVNSRNCLNEVQFALSRNKPILTVFLEETVMPAGLELALGTSHVLDRFGLDDGAFSDRVTGFIDQLNRGVHPATELESRAAYTDTESAFLALGSAREEPMSALSQETMAAVQSALRARGGTPYLCTEFVIQAVFDNAADAAPAALEAWTTMHAANTAARPSAALHVGLARSREGNYFGPAPTQLLRLFRATNPGQIVFSGDARASLDTESPGHDIGFTDDAGQLLDGSAKIDVYRVLLAAREETEPVAEHTPACISRGNLPASLSTFHGRATEIEELGDLLARARVVTLIGSGGIGKTRLSVETARRRDADYPDGVWFVDLAALERGTDIWPAIASALSLVAYPGVEPREQVLGNLRSGCALVVLDNCEHVLDQAADAVEAMVAGNPELTLLNTSRRRLEVAGENLFEVPSLAGDGNSAQCGVDLFVERARMVQHRFNPDPLETALIGEICASLEHIPLAIEIAAGQLRRASLEQIRDSALSPLQLRGKRERGTGERHRTLRHTLRWSYDLIDTNSQTVLKLLSVFSGPFREEEGIEVCLSAGHDEDMVYDAIDQLIDFSLLSRDAADPERHRVLQAIQSFGRELLEEAGELAEAERWHAAIMARRARELQLEFESDREGEAVAAIVTELPNLESAFERVLGSELELAADLVHPFTSYCYFHRGARIGAWPARILAQPGGRELRRAPQLFAMAASHTLHALGDPEEAARLVEEGLAAVAQGAESAQGWLHNVAGQVAMWTRHPGRAIEHHRLAVEKAREKGNLPCLLTSLSATSHLSAALGNAEDAQQGIAELSQLGQSLSQPTLIGYVHFARGAVAGESDAELALAEYRQSIEWARLGRNPLGVQRVSRVLNTLLAERASPEDALDIHLRALDELPEKGAAIYTLSTLGSLLAPLSSLGHAAPVAMIAGALADSPLGLDKKARRLADAARQSLGDAAYLKTFEQGGASTVEEVCKQLHALR